MPEVTVNQLPAECCGKCKYMRVWKTAMQMTGSTAVCARRAPVTRWPATQPDFWCAEFEAKVPS